MHVPDRVALAYRWAGVVSGGFNKTNAGEKENGAQYAVHSQAFHLCVGAFGVHKYHGRINKSHNTQHG